VRVADVDWIESDGNYARVWVQHKARLVSKSLAILEREVLDPARFVRVHRSAIVNVARVAAVEPGPHGDVTLVLHDGTRVACSRRYRDRLEERLYFTT
jgi:two-component system LytT family response regulator